MENKTTTIHIGEFLKAYAKKKRIFKAAWARGQGVRKETISGYFKKPTIQIQTLFDICHVLKYNFFADLAANLPPEYPYIETPHQQKIAELEKEIELLKSQNEVLMKVAGK